MFKVLAIVACFAILFVWLGPVVTSLCATSFGVGVACR